MLIAEEKLDGGMFDSGIWQQYFAGMSTVAADIETTGLSPKNCFVIIGGAVAAEDAGRCATQFFAASEDEEAELLERYGKLLRSHRVIVTYNGRGFDIPFLIKRMKKHRMDTSGLEDMYSLDIYRVLKKYSHLPELLPNMKQKSVEVFLGDSRARTDEIDGGESVRQYLEYRTAAGARKEELLGSMLLHNRDDIVRLSDMMRILKQLDLHRIMFGEGFPMTVGDTGINAGSMKLNSRGLTVTGRICGAGSTYRGFLDGAEFAADERDHSFTLNVECRDIQGMKVADTEALGLAPELFSDLAGYESGYLVLSEGDRVNCREVNVLVKRLTEKLLG